MTASLGAWKNSTPSDEYAGLMIRSRLVMISFVVAMMYTCAHMSPQQPTFSTEEWTSGSGVHEVKVRSFRASRKRHEHLKGLSFQRTGMSYSSHLSCMKLIDEQMAVLPEELNTFKRTEILIFLTAF